MLLAPEVPTTTNPPSAVEATPILLKSPVSPPRSAPLSPKDFGNSFGEGVTGGVRNACPRAANRRTGASVRGMSLVNGMGCLLSFQGVGYRLPA